MAPASPRPRIGVLAVQGDVREHLAALTELGAEATTVRRPSEVEAIDGLVIPGGESTVIDKLVRAFELQVPLRERIAAGMPAYGSCAGMILLADRITDARPDQQTLGGLDITVRRNAFGRQVDSFEQDLDFRGLEGTVHAVFIRAPWVEQVGDDVQVLARVSGGPAAGRIVAVRQGNLLATSFHPEVGADRRIHAEFVEIVRSHRQQRNVREPA
jgi:pyridoxal 5'-phosphate synthase pdxT subunit